MLAAFTLFCSNIAILVFSYLLTSIALFPLQRNRISSVRALSWDFFIRNKINNGLTHDF